jgi:hypothetical protein
MSAEQKDDTFIHEFDSWGWKTYHRLVWIDGDKRIEGDWALFEQPAFLSLGRMKNQPEADMVPGVGYFALTDYFTSTGSKIGSFRLGVSLFDGAILSREHDLTKEEHEAAQASEGEADVDDEADDQEFALKP